MVRKSVKLSLNSFSPLIKLYPKDLYSAFHFTMCTLVCVCGCARVYVCAWRGRIWEYFSKSQLNYFHLLKGNCVETIPQAYSPGSLLCQHIFIYSWLYILLNQYIHFGLTIKKEAVVGCPGHHKDRFCDLHKLKLEKFYTGSFLCNIMYIFKERKIMMKLISNFLSRTL